MRIAMGVMRHETNTFSPLPTPLAKFSAGADGDEPMHGQQAIDAYAGTNSPMAAYLDIAREANAEIDLAVAGNANPSGKVTDAAFDYMTGRICDAVARGCDAIMLDLHGAMVSESFDDAEGELLRRIREIAPDTPMAVSLDFHTNFSSAMLDNATVVTGYRTYPHVDIYETGKRSATTLMRALRGEVNPVISWASLPMLTHMIRQTPSRQPMKDIMDRAIAAEAGGEVLNASVFGGFPLADIPHAGLAAIIVSDGDPAAGEALRDELLAMAWERRADFVYEFEPLEESIAKAKAVAEGPVVLADHGDNTGAGGQSDGMAALAEVMRQGLEDVVAGPFWDPEAVAELAAAGEGAEVILELGGKTDMPALNMKGQPLQVSGRVVKLTDGQFTVTGPMGTGQKKYLGKTAVLDTGSVLIFVSENRNEPYDVGCFTHAGVDPAKKKYVLIKSRQHFRAGFEPLAKEIILVAGPGVCSSDYAQFPFKNLRRPIYPLDDISDPAGA